MTMGLLIYILRGLTTMISLWLLLFVSPTFLFNPNQTNLNDHLVMNATGTNKKYEAA